MLSNSKETYRLGEGPDLLQTVHATHSSYCSKEYKNQMLLQAYGMALIDTDRKQCVVLQTEG